MPEGVCRLEGYVLRIVLAARGGAGEKCVVFEASLHPQERVQKPPDETDPRHTLLYEKKKKVVASSGSHDLFTLICTMVLKKTSSHNATPGWRGFYHCLFHATVDFLSAQQTLNLLRV